MNFTQRYNPLQKRHRSCIVALLLVVGFGLLPVVGTAQLHIKENTQIAVKGVLTSQEPINNLQATLQGEGTLVLDGDGQELTTAPGVWLHNLRITRATGLSITSPLQLHGDLRVDTGILKLIYTVQLAGDLQLGADATVQDYHLIHTIKPMPVVRIQHHNNTLLVTTTTWVGVLPGTTNGHWLAPVAREQATTMVATFINNTAQQPPLPPPEWV